MATKREIEENNKLLREQNELLKQGKIISEETLDDNRDFANILRDQTKQIQFQVSEKNQLRSIGNSLNKIAQEAYSLTHEELADLKTAKSLLDFQKKVKKDILGLESLRGKIISEDPKLQKAINDTIKEQIQAAKKLNDQLKVQQDLTDKISENRGVKTFGFVEDITKAIPGLRKFSKPFEEAAKATREAALNNAEFELHSKGINKLTEYNLKTGSGLSKQRLKQLNLTRITGETSGKDAAKLLKTYKASASKVGVMKAGFKALGPAIKTALGPLGLIMLAVDAVKMIVDLFIAADANTTAIAKNLNISKAAARTIRDEFQQIAASSSNVLVTTKSLVEAQGQLTKALGATTYNSQRLAENQVFFTKNLGIAGDKAASMQLMFQATGQDIESLIDSTLEFSKQQAKSNGYLIAGEDILREISNTSAEVAGYYGFNNKALGKAILLSRQYGLSLMQTQSITKGLLNFESSIGNELEAELLTGKELNFEKARMLALTGDSAGAAAEVLKQAQSLTDEQRKNPILMQSMAKAAGLSVEELNKAYLIEKNLNMSRKDYNELLEKGAATGQQQQISDLMMLGRTKEEIIKTLSSQEKFSAALEKAKDSFAALVDDGYLDMLMDTIVSLVDNLSWLTGAKSKQAVKKIDSLVESKDIDKDQAKKLKEQAKELPTVVDAYKSAFSKGLLGIAQTYYKRYKAGQAITEIDSRAQKRDNKEKGEPIPLQPISQLELATGGITTGPTRALIGEAGQEAVIPLTELYSKFDALLAAVEKGGNVYMDGNIVGHSLALASNKSN